MAKYKEQRNEKNELTGYIRVIDGASIPIANGNRDYQTILKWIAEGNVPDPVGPYASSLAEARKKRVKKIKEEAKGLYRTNTDQYSNQYSMELALGQTPTAIPAVIITYYGDMKQAFIDAKNTINAESDMDVIKNYQANFPSTP